MTRNCRWLLAVDSDHLARAAAQIVLETVAAAVQERNVAALAVSGGSTPQKLFETLADEYHKARLPWEKLHVFWVDERCVPPNHADSNYGMTKTTLLSKVPLPQANIHRMQGETQPASTAAKAYESELKSFFKVDKSLPVFDLILLGIGTDGHTASLFPKTDALEQMTKWVTATYVERLNAQRITLTLPVINHARRVLFLVSGKEKAAILKEVLPPENPVRLPAQRIKPTSGELIWLFDRAAASDLPPDIRYRAHHLEGGNAL